MFWADLFVWGSVVSIIASSTGSKTSSIVSSSSQSEGAVTLKTGNGSGGNCSSPEVVATVVLGLLGLFIYQGTDT